MSLFDSLNIAASSLRTLESSISIISQNVANAQTPNYAARTPVVNAIEPGGGVEIASVQRATDQALQQQTLTQSSQAAGDSALSNLYQQLENVTGGSSGTPILSGAMTQFQSAWQAYEASPESTAAQQNLLQSATGLTQALSNTAAGVQQLQTAAQANVGNDVTSLNSNLATIAKLNTEIIAAQGSKTDVSGLEDQRDAAIASVAQLVSIRTVARSDGSVAVFMPNGLSLASTTAASFSWDGTNITDAGSATSLNSSFQGGSIGATLGFVATDAASVASADPSLGVLQKLSNQLNAFAQSFYDTTAAPPPAFEAAYDGATTEPGELASSFFTTSDGSAAANAFDLVVNPSLLNGTNQIKQAAATPVVAALTKTNQSLNAGALSVSNQTYAGIADAIMGTVSANAAGASSAAKSSAAVSTALSAQLSSETGVNLDQQMSQLIVLQNSYSASARVMTAANAMLTALMAIGQ
ncbi:MAG TPA: flagellar hook-associated protein FlgK [Stellaceae bacterium]|nr:flagellar hook-associated protein FlgK [Stellaceae bacterium]